MNTNETKPVTAAHSAALDAVKSATPGTVEHNAATAALADNAASETLDATLAAGATVTDTGNADQQGATPASETPTSDGGTVTADQPETAETDQPPLADLTNPVLAAAMAAMGATPTPHQAAMTNIAIADDKANQGATPDKPVKPLLTGPTDKNGKPIKGGSEKNSRFKQRLAQWQAKVDAQKASTQGATPKPAAPAAPVKPTPAAPQGNTPAKPTVEAKPAKPAKLGKAETLAANGSEAMPGGYDVSKWPKWFNGMVLSHEAIMAARAMNLYADTSKNILGIAAALEQGRPENGLENDRVRNVFDWGVAFVSLPPHAHSKPDNKQNAPLGAADKGYIMLDKSMKIAGQNPASTVKGSARIVYRATLTSTGLKMVTAYFAAHKLQVPVWLSDPQAAREQYEATRVKAAETAAREAKRLERQQRANA